MEKTTELTLHLGMPPSSNTYYRSVPGKGVLISKRGREYRKEVIERCRVHAGTYPADARLNVLVVLRPPDRRRRDIDNFCGKALLDSLMAAEIIPDDSQVDSLTMLRANIDRKNPGVTVYINTINAHAGKVYEELEL